MNETSFQGTREEWQVVFAICIAVGLGGAILFVILGDGKEQEWAKDPNMNVEFDFVRRLSLAQLNDIRKSSTISSMASVDSNIAELGIDSKKIADLSLHINSEKVITNGTNPRQNFDCNGVESSNYEKHEDNNLNDIGDTCMSLPKTDTDRNCLSGNQGQGQDNTPNKEIEDGYANLGFEVGDQSSLADNVVPSGVVHVKENSVGRQRTNEIPESMHGQSCTLDITSISDTIIVRL